MADEIQPPQQSSAGSEPVQPHPDDQDIHEQLLNFKEKHMLQEIQKGEASEDAIEVIERGLAMREIHQQAGPIDQAVDFFVQLEKTIDHSDLTYRILIQGNHFDILELVEFCQQQFHQKLMDTLSMMTHIIHLAQNAHKKTSRLSSRLKRELSRGRYTETRGAPCLLELVKAFSRRCDDWFTELISTIFDGIGKMHELMERALVMLHKAGQRREEVEQILHQQSG